MRKLSLLIIISITNYLIISAQELKDIDIESYKEYTNNFTIAYTDSVINFSVTDAKPKKLNNETFYFWYKNQDVNKTQGGYVGKLLDGPFTAINKSNDLLSQGRFEDGVKVDEWKFWDREGNLYSLLNYKKGQLNGKQFIYHKNNQVKIKSNYRNGVKNGKELVYDQKGRLVLETRYKNGLKHGKEILYQGDEKIIKKYKKGQLVNED
ncbi:toxin-antitoxin system YwqK family antitoxin [Mangrovivirga cuniculi]|uniref:Antitoxin component YwqK of the YwqJK toxin-antitoxin module n=1 Tax=Mangrovivirga cuniculi TaxID=2715131 RepID=A0A4D7JS55_9BACT|nr:hypothetical protein [Mangrovivirga cuniculi]QCK13765.1 hypothetical protein DCC35_02830 [Mangrovivirga cuniculi]